MSYKITERLEPIYVNSDLIKIARLMDSLCDQLKWVAGKISITPLRLENNSNGVCNAHAFTLYLERLSEPSQLPFAIVIEIISGGIVFEEVRITLQKGFPFVDHLTLNCKFDEILLAVQSMDNLINAIEGFSVLTTTTLVFTSGLLKVGDNG